MANIYVRSTDGLDADNGSTWALAKATLNGAAAIDAAGDTIWVSQAHSETPAGNFAPSLAGTDPSPEYILCGNDGAEPPTTLATTATVTANGGNISLGATSYWYGITFACASSVIGLCNTNTRQQRVDRCTFRLTSGSTASTISFLSSVSASGRVVVTNCKYKFNLTTQGLSLGVGGYLHEVNGSFESGTASPTTLLKAVAPGVAIFDGLDMSNLGTSFNFMVPPGPGLRITLRRMKFPTSWAGNLISSAITSGSRVSMYNYTIGSMNYMLWIEDLAGTIKSETTLVMTNGASDGVTPFSWKMTSNANAEPLVTHLVSDEMVIWSDAVGGSPTIQKTITVNILHDSATNLTDDEVWLEVSYLSATNSPLGSVITDRKTDILATAADQNSSSEAWTTTGMTNPNKQKLSVTVTPGQKGFYVCKVVLAKASKTIYVDPAPVLS